MARSISIYRRKPNIVDLLVRKRAGKIGFRFSAAANWDSAVFTAFATVPNQGLKSKNVQQVGSVGSQFKDHVRFLFDPDDYTATVAAVDDSKIFYIRLEAQNPDGSFDAAEAIHVVLTPPVQPNRPFILRGLVPSGASLANSLELQLPYQFNDWEIQNDGGADAYVAFDPTGAEYRVQPASTNFRSFEQFVTSISQIFMRGAGGATTISAIFTQRNNEMV
jgi:hypothetical protein